MTTKHEIQLRPAMRFALLKISPLLFLSLVFLLAAWRFSPYLVILGLATLVTAWCRMLLIRSNRYIIRAEIIRTSYGILFKRTDELEMYRIKDYVILQPPGLQFLGLMNVVLKSTDTGTPILRLIGIPRSDLIEIIREHVHGARQHNKIYEIN